MVSPAETIERFLDRAGIPFARNGESAWAAELSGERKLTIPVSFVLRSGTLAIESFFMRRPQENVERFYEILLRRNARAYGVHFAIDAIGDVYLVGARGAEGLTEEELDRIVGALLVEADGMFDAAIEVGFATYLQADRRWRARAGPPGG